MAAAAVADMANQVDKNYQAFQKLLPELLQTHAGKFTVMHEGTPVEFFDSFADAVRFGNAKFGAGKFSVQEVTSKNVNLGFYSYALHNTAN
jgi:hypothetical protein